MDSSIYKTLFSTFKLFKLHIATLLLHKSSAKMNDDWALVWSNLIYLLPVAVLLYKSWNNRTKFGVEIGTLLSVLIVSAMHHACDTASIQQCYQRPMSQYFLDLFFSYLAIIVTFGAFYHKFLRALYHCVAFPIVAFVTSYYGDDVNAATVMISIAVCLFILHEIPRWCKEIWVLLRIVPAGVFFGLALWAKSNSDLREQNEDPPHYLKWHVMWHVFGGVASAFLFADLAQDTHEERIRLKEHKQRHRQCRRYSTHN